MTGFDDTLKFSADVYRCLCPEKLPFREVDFKNVYIYPKRMYGGKPSGSGTASTHTKSRRHMAEPKTEHLSKDSEGQPKTLKKAENTFKNILRGSMRRFISVSWASFGFIWGLIGVDVAAWVGFGIPSAPQKVQLNRVTFQKPAESDSYEFQKNPNVKISSEDNGELEPYCDSLLTRCYEVQVLPLVIQEANITRVRSSGRKFTNLFHPESRRMSESTCRRSRNMNEGPGNKISTANSTSCEPFNSGGETQRLAPAEQKTFQTKSESEMMYHLKILILRWAEASAVRILRPNQFTLPTIQNLLDSPKFADRIRAIISLLLYRGRIRNYLEDEITFKLRLNMRNDALIVGIAVALVLTVLQKSDDDTKTFLLHIVKKRKDFCLQRNIDSQGPTRVEQLDRWISATCLGAVGYYNPVVYNYIFKMLFSRSKQLIPCGNPMSGPGNKGLSENHRTAADKYFKGEEDHQEDGYSDGQLDAVMQIEQLEKRIRNECLARLTNFLETHIIVKLLRENNEAQTELLVHLSHRDWRARILACWLLKLTGNQFIPVVRHRLQTMAVFDSHPILRMSSYDALVSLRIPVDAPDGILVHGLSENVCANCCPKSDGPGGLSAIQTEYTSLRTVEVLHKLASEAVDEESKLAILATALCNSASVIRKTACTLIASTGNPTNSFWIRRLLKIITRDPDSGVKLSAIQALRKCALQVADVKQMSSPPIILEHLHQSLRNAARDEWNSDVRFKLLQLLIDLIEVGVITRETNEDITDRNVEQWLYEPEVYLNERVDKTEVQAAQYITQNERTDGSKLLTFKSRGNQLNRLSFSPISSRIIKSIAYESPRSMTSSNHRMNGPKKLVQFQLSRTYQLLKHFEHADPCPGIRRMLSSRTDTLFTSLLNKENDKSGSDEVYFLADDRQLIRQMVFKLGRDAAQIYHDMTQINKKPSKGHLDNIINKSV